VLRDNYEQNILLGNARAQSHSMLPVHQRFIRALEKAGELNRELEFLPRDSVIDQRLAAGLGLTSPEFSVLVAYSKITMKRALLASKLPRRGVVLRGAARLLPARDHRSLRGPATRAPAAPRDRRHARGQRLRQPGRHHVRLPGAGGVRAPRCPRSPVPTP
jgi:hypothetical protein